METEGSKVHVHDNPPATPPPRSHAHNTAPRSEEGVEGAGRGGRGKRRVQERKQKSRKREKINSSEETTNTLGEEGGENIGIYFEGLANRIG